MADTQYLKGIDDGKEIARKQILDFIEHHLAEEVDITSEDIASEIEYLQRQDIREKQNG
jgi:hypothetical protein